MPTCETAGSTDEIAAAAAALEEGTAVVMGTVGRDITEMITVTARDGTPIEGSTETTEMAETVGTMTETAIGTGGGTTTGTEDRLLALLVNCFTSEGNTIPRFYFRAIV